MKFSTTPHNYYQYYLYCGTLRLMMPTTLREDGALTKDLGSWSQRGQHHRGKVQGNKVQSPSMHTNLVNDNWLLLVTCTRARMKSSGFSIKQCQILMIFLFPASTMNSLMLLVVLMNVCYCFPLLLSFCHFLHLLSCRMGHWKFWYQQNNKENRIVVIIVNA